MVDELFSVTRLVIVALVALNSVIVPEATVRSDIVVVARLDVPVTDNVPVVVELVVVRLVITEVIASRNVENILVEVAFTNIAEVANRLVFVALVMLDVVPIRLFT